MFALSALSVLAIDLRALALVQLTDRPSDAGLMAVSSGKYLILLPAIHIW